ncbi:MAG: DUF433 domain-containing protein [Cytophagales bacterium]|nr:MAG: DUF433 domain-containing protein [Cytophagales bacterium]
MKFNYKELIVINPNIRFGRPCVVGTRIAVYDVLGWLALGMSHAEIIEDFPQLNNEHILACLQYVTAKERQLKYA